MRGARRILGIDPGLRALGYGVIDAGGRRPSLVAFGAVLTRSDRPLPERLKILYDGLRAVILEHEPGHMVFERLIYCKNASTALLLGQARGAAILAGANAGLPMTEFNPTEIKSAVTGRGRAGKEQVQKMVALILSLPEPPEPDHAADALAAAIAYAHSHPAHLDWIRR